MSMRSEMLIAGDIGGTHSRLGVFDRTGLRPQPIAVRTFRTLDFPDLPSMLAEFLEDASLTSVSMGSACFGVAGPVAGDTATLTNAPWTVDAGQVSERFRIQHVALLNDLQAMAYAVPGLSPSDLCVLQEGSASPDGNAAVIAAGTGLGEAVLHRVGGSFVASATEAGHADFAARTEREITVLRALTARFGRVEIERVISGRGMVNLFPLTHRGACAGGVDIEHPEAAAAISAAALERRCDGCIEALDIFVEAYGAEAGNLALRSVATGGVFVGGGIAPRIVPALTNGRFMRAFRAKAPLEALLGAVPVKVMLNDDAALLGAAAYAVRRARHRQRADQDQQDQ